jgi:hypothetical protein
MLDLAHERYGAVSVFRRCRLAPSSGLESSIISLPIRPRPGSILKPDRRSRRNQQKPNVSIRLAWLGWSQTWVPNHKCPLRSTQRVPLNDRDGRRADISAHAFCSSLPLAATLQLGASAPAATPPARSPPPAAPVARIQAPLTPRSPSRATLSLPSVGTAVSGKAGERFFLKARASTRRLRQRADDRL